MDKRDIKAFSLLYTESSNLERGEKKQTYNFIINNPIEESMNLLMTGYINKLTESQRKLAAEQFSTSHAIRLIDFLNEHAEHLANKMFQEGVWPSSAEWEAMKILWSYGKTSIGQTHTALATKITNAISKLSGDTFNVLGVETISPLKTKKYLDIFGGVWVGIGAIGAGLLIASVSYVAAKAYSRLFKKYEMQCKKQGLKGPAKKLCAATAKMNAYEAKLKIMASKKSMCSKTKDPQKCGAKFDKKLNKMKKKLADMQTIVKSVNNTLKDAASQVAKIKASKEKNKR